MSTYTGPERRAVIDAVKVLLRHLENYHDFTGPSSDLWDHREVSIWCHGWEGDDDNTEQNTFELASEDEIDTAIAEIGKELA